MCIAITVNIEVDDHLPIIDTERTAYECLSTKSLLRAHDYSFVYCKSCHDIVGISLITQSLRSRALYSTFATYT